MRPSAAAAPEMQRVVDRERAIRADPRVGDNPTGDLDAGVYAPRHTQVGGVRSSLLDSLPTRPWGRT